MLDRFREVFHETRAKSLVQILVWTLLIITPLILCSSFLDAFFEQVAAKAKNEEITSFNRILDFIDKYSVDAHYFHSIFSSEFAGGDYSLTEFKKKLRTIRNLFPDGLKILAWDHSGKYLEKLSDEKSFRYVIGKIHEFITMLVLSWKNDDSINPSQIPDVEKKWTLIANFLGQFTVFDHLFRPLLGSRLGKCIYGDPLSDFPLYWFNKGKNFSVLVFVHRNYLKKNLGILHAIKWLQKKHRQLNIGYILSKKESRVFPDLTLDEKNLLLLAYNRFLNSGISHEFGKIGVIAFRKLEVGNHFGYVFGKNKDEFNGKILKNHFLANAFSFMVISGFVILCYRLRMKKTGISVKWKLLGLFLYANGLPLLILGLLGINYLESKETSLIKQQNEINNSLIKNFDEEFAQFKNLFAKKLRFFLQTNDFLSEEKIESPKNLDFIAKACSRFAVEEIYFLNPAGENLYTDKRFTSRNVPTIYKHFAVKALELSNYKGIAEDFDEFHVLNANRSMHYFERVIIRALRLNYQSPFHWLTSGILKENSSIFTFLVGDKNKRSYGAILLMIWSDLGLQKIFLSEKMEALRRDSGNSLVFALSPMQDKVLGHNDKVSMSRIKGFLYKAALDSSAYEEIELQGKRYIFSAAKNHFLSEYILGVGFPLDRIEAQIDFIKISILGFIGLNLALFSCVAFLIYQHFFPPLQQLQNAIIAIQHRDFNFRSRIDTADEIAILGEALNETIEGMKELEIAGVIQESLFPPPSLRVGSFEIFAKNQTMSRVGGDYFDFFKINENLAGLVLGDVSGHGIQAGLIMAMAKSCVLMQDLSMASNIDLINSFNLIFSHLKKAQLSKMMTVMCGQFDSEKAEARIVNAGQCFPVLIEAGGTNSTALEIFGGLPVGVMRKIDYKSQTIKFNSGDTLALFTDGFLEAQNLRGEFVGDQRFTVVLRACWDPSLEKFAENVFDFYKDWAVSTEDDLSLVLVRYE